MAGARGNRSPRRTAGEEFTSLGARTAAGFAAGRSRSRRYMAERIHLIEAGMPAPAQGGSGPFAEGRRNALERPVMILTGTDCPPVVPEIAEVVAARRPDLGLAVAPGPALCCRSRSPSRWRG